MNNLIEIKKDLSVLILEDNDGDFLLIEDYLIEEFKTVQITRFETFIEFKDQISEQKVRNTDIILLDLHLPDYSGIELIEKIFIAYSGIPIIILTGFSDLSLAKKSLKIGIEDFLIKDEITPSILHKSIEFALSRSQYVKHIEAQNEKLRKIAWTQSHVVRAPLSRILGIINLLESESGINEDLKLWLNQLRDSSNDLDVLVRKITEDAQEIELNRNYE
ncbi:MAG: response regulator [Balneolaceae bacterium]